MLSTTTKSLAQGNASAQEFFRQIASLDVI
jgi:hypothetical protein